MLFHTPLNSTPVSEFWVFLSVDRGGEGIVATEFGGTMFPLVSANSDLVEKMKSEAAHVARLSGKQIVLARFSSRENIWRTEG